MNQLQTFVNNISISPDVFALRPDCTVLIVAMDNIANGPSDEESRGWLEEACRIAQTSDNQPHLDAWHATYRAFGAKPQKFRPSFDALLRRTSTGLPQINKVVDAYNAVSVKYGLPVGGENIDGYDGPLRLMRADGSESFDTVVNGQPAIEIVEPGEVVWRDDSGVTCRRWNWRQGLRTRVHEETNRAFFLFESLSPFPVNQLHAASNEVVEKLATSTSSVVTRLITQN